MRILGILGNLIIALLEIECTFWNINHQMSEQEGPDTIYSKILIYKWGSRSPEGWETCSKLRGFWGSGLYSFLGATIATYPKLDGLKQKFIVSQFLRLEVQNEGYIHLKVSQGRCLLRAMKNMPNPWLPVAADIPWLVDGFLPVSSHGLPSVYDCPNFPFVYRNQSYWIIVHSSDITQT